MAVIITSQKEKEKGEPPCGTIDTTRGSQFDNEVMNHQAMGLHRTIKSCKGRSYDYVPGRSICRLRSLFNIFLNQQGITEKGVCLK